MLLGPRQLDLPSPPPPRPQNEEARIAAIERYRLTGLGREPAFDHVTALAARLFDAPMSVVSIVGEDEQCFRGAVGVDVEGTPRDIAFCSFAILGDDVMVVEDATDDARFRTNPLVDGMPFIRFYAGAPLTVDGELRVGTLCIFDNKPRAFNQEECERLKALAQVVVDLIEMRVGDLAAKEQERQALEQRELLSLTVENVTEGVALVDGGLRMILWNQAFCDMFGYEHGLVKEGMNAAELIAITAQRGDLGDGEPQRLVEGLVGSIKSSPSRRIEIRRRDGHVLDIWRKTISGGRFIMTARDVTEERQIARLKDELVSTVSHELRTPLTAISGSLGLMEAGVMGELPTKVKHLVDIACKNSTRLGRLVDDLLDMDKLQSGKAEFDFVPTDLAGLIREAVDQNRPYADRFGVSISLDLTEQPLIATVDERRMLQVLSNLLSNAAKFSPPDSQITVRLVRFGKRARISVCDQGPGVSPAFRTRIFSRFAQEDQSSQRGQAGTGLGLAITKNIVEHHGGTIELDTKVEHGATFHVELPVGD